MPRRSNLLNETDNLLLAELPQKEYKRLLPKLDEVTLEQGRQLISPGEPLKYVYFPNKMMISLVSSTEEGTTVETGLVGREGMLGIPVIFGTGSTPMQSMVQIAGTALRMRAREFKNEYDRSEPLQNVLLRYLHVLIIRISQTAACNKLHSIEDRLARWLLMTSDCIDSDEIAMTHEFLALMLGARRAGVSESAARLRAKSLIDYTWGQLTVVNRAGLEKVACECYDMVVREQARVFPKSRR